MGEIYVFGVWEEIFWPKKKYISGMVEGIRVSLYLSKKYQKYYKIINEEDNVHFGAMLDYWGTGFLLSYDLKDGMIIE